MTIYYCCRRVIHTGKRFILLFGQRYMHGWWISYMFFSWRLDWEFSFFNTVNIVQHWWHLELINIHDNVVVCLAKSLIWCRDRLCGDYLLNAGITFMIEIERNLTDSRKLEVGFIINIGSRLYYKHNTVRLACPNPSLTRYSRPIW